MIMRRPTIFTILAILVVLSYASERKAIPAKRYAVDLEVEPTKRWESVLAHFDRSALMKIVNQMLDTYVRQKELILLAELIAKDLDNYIPQPYADELRGISQYYNAKLGDLVLANLAYDVSAWDTSGLHACTSIVTQDKNGGLLHSRNLDYAFGDGLRNITVEIVFHRGGIVKYVGTTYVGYVGLLTAAKPNAFTISGDERNKGFWWENLLSAAEKSWPTLLRSRQIVNDAEDYDSALEILKNAKTIAPMYFIVGGIKPHEGAIVVLDRWGALNITRMTDRLEHNWFVVETNYDPWNPPPASDDRRDSAIKSMESFGQSRMDVGNLYKVMSTPPVFNPTTTYTTIMSAANMSVYQTMIRWDYPRDD